ncbi:MAG: Tm-1-like ATP-binding domain-containing protein, partial [Solirubrobacteraceae bacterium]
MTDAPGIALIGTLDTKGAEIAYVRDRLRALGARPVVVDSGILGEPDGCAADVPREEVARAGGHDLEA